MKGKQIIYGLTAAVGAALLLAAVLAAPRFGLGRIPEVPRVFLGGIGGGLVGFGAMRFAELRLRRGAAGKRMRVEEQDERNVMLRGKGAYMAFVCMLPLTALAVLACVATDNWLPALLCGGLLAAHPVLLGVFIGYDSRRM